MLDNGTAVTEQEPILEHVKNYYQSLFKNRDGTLDSIDFKNTFVNLKYKTVTDPRIGILGKIEIFHS